ncbi:MAG: thiamine pyrophosphate-dependent dehydrogenase E1 component subunit alpha [Streptomycetaceae bacterium]|nr:thiamine pyrophosphate-dependent dehydrogenase E1 component subunit alpha [Streptomycetaceae bacterium]
MTTTSRAKRGKAPAAVASDLLRAMYLDMARSRAVEELMVTHIRDNGVAGYWHPGWGSEGAGIGATAAMRRDDYLFYQGRGVSWAIGKGMAPGPILGDVLGKTTGSTGGKGAGVPHWADPDLGIMGEGATLGSVYPLAAGAALAAQLRGSDQIALAHFGDGTAARGTFHETLLQSAVWKLPLVFFCDNNGLAVSTRFEDMSPTATVAERASAYGVPGVHVDGQDAVAVLNATREAIARARAGDGPTLVEARTVRLRGHYEGDPQQYRTADEFDTYRDPVDVLAAHLDDATASKLREQAEADVQAAYDEAMAAPYPDPSIITKDVFA